MMRRLALSILFGVAALFSSCRKEEDITKHEWYIDPSHVLFYGEKGAWFDRGGVEVDGDGNYVVVNTWLFSNDGQEEVLKGVVFKASSDGRILWDTVEQVRSSFEDILSLDPHRFLILAYRGDTHTDFSFIEFSDDGRFNSIVNVPDLSYTRKNFIYRDGYVYVSRINYGSNDEPDRLCIEKYTLSGDLVWSRCDTNHTAYASCAIAFIGDNLFTTAMTTDTKMPVGKLGFLAMMVDTSGNLKWGKIVSIVADTNTGGANVVAGPQCLLSATEGYDGSIVGVIEGPAIIKLDRSGDVVWYRALTAYGGKQWITIPYKLLKTPDGLYTSVGQENNCPAIGCVSLLKFDDGGDVHLMRYYFWGPSQSASDAEVTPDGNIIITGDGEAPAADSSGKYDRSVVFLLKLDQNGNPVW